MTDRSQSVAVIVGVGAGLGAALARRFAERYAVALVVLIVAIAAAVAINYSIGWLIGRFNLKSAGGGLRIALICWFAFLLMPYTTIEAFSAFGRNPAEIVLINMGQYLVLFAIAGVVLGAWRRNA